MKIGERAKDAIYIFALFVLTIIFFRTDDFSQQDIAFT